MAKTKFHSSIKVVKVEHLKNTKFSFIDNEILKENIAIKNAVYCFSRFS